MGEILSVKKKALPLHRFRSQGANIDAEVAQLVEHNLAKVRVASSSLVFRSIFSNAKQKCFANHRPDGGIGRHAGLKAI